MTILLSDDINFVILCETLSLYVCTEHWQNDDCWIQFYICRQQNVFGKLLQRKYCNTFTFSIPTDIAVLFSQSIGIAIGITFY